MSKYFAICEKPDGGDVELTILPVKGDTFKEATLAASLPPGITDSHWVLTREQLQNLVEDGQRALTFDHHKLIEFINKIEASHFRTQEDTGANLNAMLIWNQVRKLAGLKRLQLDDLASYCSECDKYHPSGKHMRVT